MRIDELNNKYFELYSDLYAAQPVLPAKQFEAMSKALSAEYGKELEVVVGQKALEAGRSVFELRFKLKNYLPRRRLFFWWNKTAKALLNRYKAEFAAELERLLVTEAAERETTEETLPAVSDKN